MPIKSLQIVFASKSFEDSKSSYETCSSRCELKKQESSQIFVEKVQRYANITVVCLHWQVYWKVVQRRSGKKMGRLICIQCKTTSCFLCIREHKLPDICILVSWKNEEVPRRVPSNIQRFSRRKIFSEKKRWIFQTSCAWHENSGLKTVFDISEREVH